MSITNRLSWYFLAALGVVLVIFSLSLYFIARWHLGVQADRHLDTAMHVLVAACEVHPDDVQWEPLERKVPLEGGPDADQIRWTIRDEAGHLIDRSANLALDPLVADDGQWLVLSRRLQSGQFEPVPLNAQLTTLVRANDEQLPLDRSAQRKSFDLTVGLSTGPMHAVLASLAGAMCVVSAITLLTAAFWSRWLCRRALLPVRQMADSARALEREPNRNDLLVIPSGEDELTYLGRAFNDLLATLRDSIERQRRFASDASHQLRTPLTAMLAAVDVSLRHDRPAETYQHVLELVQRRGRELTMIVETLLLLARGEKEALAGFHAIDLRECCRERLERWQNHERADNLHLQVGSTAIVAQSHPLLVGQVVDNLIDNACKYSEAGTAVSVYVATEGNSAVVSVVDQGPGICQEELSRVFEPFFRGSQAKRLSRSGAGLGLSIAERLATLAGGRLEVESGPSTGSIFRFVLPRVSTGSPSDQVAASTEPTSKKQQIDGPKVRTGTVGKL
jgi:two-component system OmpR family sensor kinase